jgi:hypothetical protein
MPSARRLLRQLTDRRVPLRTRLGLLAAEARRRLRPRAGYAVRYGSGVLLLSHDDFAVDRKSLDFVLEGSYATDYRGAVVLDIGAHKGYFGAYALAHGARAVVSFEPERANVALLEESAASFRTREADWRVVPVAVGAAAGEAELHVMSASWGHILPTPSPSTRSGRRWSRSQPSPTSSPTRMASPTEPESWRRSTSRARSARPSSRRPPVPGRA